MAELKNPKWEAFAQSLALGMNNVEAAKAAGYPGDRGNSSHMAKRPTIQQRVAEIRLSMPEPEPAAAPEPSAANGNGTNRVQLERLREEAVRLKQTNAAVQAQKELSRLERDEARGKEKGLSLVALAQHLIPLYRWALQSGKTAEEIVIRQLGIVDPRDLLALGVKPVGNGHAKSA